MCVCVCIFGHANDSSTFKYSDKRLVGLGGTQHVQCEFINKSFLLSKMKVMGNIIAIDNKSIVILETVGIEDLLEQ